MCCPYLAAQVCSATCYQQKKVLKAIWNWCFPASCGLWDASDIWISKLPISSNMVRALGRGVAGKVVDLDYSRRFLQASNDSRPPFSPSKVSRPAFTWPPAPRRRLLSHLRAYMWTSQQRSHQYVFYAFYIPSRSPPPSLPQATYVNIRHLSTRGWWRWGTAEGGEGQAKGMSRCSQHETMQEYGQTGHLVHSQTFPWHWCCRGHIMCKPNRAFNLDHQINI